MGIDHFLDMGRSAINVLGNGIATAMLVENEGLLRPTRKRSRTGKWRKRKPDPAAPFH
ncbi:hypothetical protein LNQ03_02075 [Klebsiella pneumoniae subsp. pneumoniae]|nr:hypothetical protein [Klebsiella pneumoniae subsp. pneumoniae]